MENLNIHFLSRLHLESFSPTSSSLLCSKYYHAIRFVEAIIDLRLSIHLHARWSHKLKTLQIMSIPNKIKSTQPKSQIYLSIDRAMATSICLLLISSPVPETFAERDRDACREGSVHLVRGKRNCLKQAKIVSLKPVLAFQPLRLATLGKWATTHDRVGFLSKNCSWTLLPGSTWLRTPTSSKLQNTFCFFKTCWWLTGLSRLYDASQPPGSYARYSKTMLKI